MGNKDIDDIERVMDRNRANRVARQNGEDGFFWAVGCVAIALALLGFVGTSLVEIFQHII